MSLDKKSKGSGTLVSIVMIAVSLLVAMLVSEILIRAFYPQQIRLTVSQWDPYVGFVPAPNLEGFAINEDFTMHVKVNSQGLRDREFDYNKPDKTLRIGSFGDSFTFGEGVQDDEPYPKILEQLLNRDSVIRNSGVKVEVLNFGIGKTGTSHQLAWYQKEGKKYDLDIVLLGFSGGNDFGDNRDGVFYLDGDRLVHNPTAYSNIRKIQKFVSYIPLYQWLSANSHLVNFARKAATIFDDKKRKKKGKTRNIELGMSRDDYNRKLYRLTRRLVEEFEHEARAEGSGFMLVHMPARWDRHLSEEDYLARKIGPQDQILHAEHLLKDFGSEGMPVLDLVPVMAALDDYRKYYFVHDTHPNKEGHIVFAEAIYDFVVEDVVKRAQEISK